MTQLISTLPYAQRFPARVAEGLEANLPAAPEGLGDLYYASDTLKLYTSNSAGDGWVTTPTGTPSTRTLSDVQDVAPSDGDVLIWNNGNSRYEPGVLAGAITGAAVEFTTQLDILGLSSATITWATEMYDSNGYFTAPATTLTVPAGLGGVYRVHFTAELHLTWEDGAIRLDVDGTPAYTYSFNNNFSQPIWGWMWVVSLTAGQAINIDVENFNPGQRSLANGQLLLELIG